MDFHGEKRSNQTHESKTDPDAKLARKAKGKEPKLSYSGNLLVENRNGLIVNAELLEANGRAERDAALVMLEKIPDNGRITVGGDKLKHRGILKVGWIFTFAAAAYNLVRLRKLVPIQSVA